MQPRLKEAFIDDQSKRITPADLGKSQALLKGMEAKLNPSTPRQHENNQSEAKHNEERSSKVSINVLSLPGSELDKKEEAKEEQTVGD